MITSAWAGAASAVPSSNAPVTAVRVVLIKVSLFAEIDLCADPEAGGRGRFVSGQGFVGLLPVAGACRSADAVADDQFGCRHDFALDGLPAGQDVVEQCG